MWGYVKPISKQRSFSIYFIVRDNLRAVVTVSHSERLRRTRAEIEYGREILSATNDANIDTVPGAKLYFVLFGISILSLYIPIVLSNY
jgi:hypothetical protein